MIRLTTRKMIRAKQVKLMMPEGSMNIVGEVLVNRLGLVVIPDWVTKSMAEVTEMCGCIWYLKSVSE
jgi:hypothetical protein